ncbi:hypothetical protein H181DRAFT_01382 [Streptomyces sp. WMMB 714]|uniref:hypothetical protein n=1 Tax=Streptomyces sp. WMMB 714 TaxID=1286822 RepID=UPI0005F7B16E|nr:hypothetical protein [Streptomyces sp. WMMB 714]SCK19367.1 hypothetical protein H181DRAFT_01382 [Streptomyces sp. WMMB 714]
MADFEDGRPAGHDGPAYSGPPASPAPTGASRRAWRTAAWVCAVAGAAALFAGVVVGDGLLLATGLILGGVAGHLATPEYTRQRPARSQPSQRPRPPQPPERPGRPERAEEPGGPRRPRPPVP